jgi:hypothetical protein
MIVDVEVVIETDAVLAALLKRVNKKIFTKRSSEDEQTVKNNALIYMIVSLLKFSNCKGNNFYKPSVEGEI